MLESPPLPRETPPGSYTPTCRQHELAGGRTSKRWGQLPPLQRETSYVRQASCAPQSRLMIGAEPRPRTLCQRPCPQGASPTASSYRSGPCPKLLLLHQAMLHRIREFSNDIPGPGEPRGAFRWQIEDCGRFLTPKLSEQRHALRQVPVRSTRGGSHQPCRQRGRYRL
jgi:hypothetical protein